MAVVYRWHNHNNCIACNPRTLASGRAQHALGLVHAATWSQCPVSTTCRVAECLCALDSDCRMSVTAGTPDGRHSHGGKQSAYLLLAFKHLSDMSCSTCVHTACICAVQLRTAHVKHLCCNVNGHMAAMGMVTVRQPQAYKFVAESAVQAQHWLH